MIEQLNGTHETVHHKRETHLRLYINDECEHYPPHWHTDMEILCPLEGDYRAVCENREYVLHPGDILLIGAGRIHDLPAAEGKRIIFQINWAPVNGIMGIQTVLNRLQPCCLVTNETMPLVYEKVHDDLLDICTFYQENLLTSEASVYSRAIDMLSLIDRSLQDQAPGSSVPQGNSFRQHNEAMLLVCNYIAEHCSEPITLDEAAGIAGFSRYYFERIFKDYTDQSFHQYLISKRLARAEELLVETSLPVTEVALQSGFASSAAFSKAFRQVRGIAPSKFRSKYGDIHENHTADFELGMKNEA